jgi:hypothetical protein
MGKVLGEPVSGELGYAPNIMGKNEAIPWQ